MTQEQIAKAVVLITNVIKLNTSESAIIVRQAIVNELADYLTADEIIMLLTGLFDALHIEYSDVDDGIQTILETGIGAVSDIEYNSLWQDIAQGLFYVLSIVKGFLPPKWSTVITSVLNAYTELKGK